MPEMLDLFDRERHPLGRTLRRGDAPAPGEYWQVADIWIVNPEGKLLIQKRAHEKDAWPDKWSCTGGAVQSGESPEEGFIREMTEELGIAPNMATSTKLCEYVSTHGIHDIWLVAMDIRLCDLTLQREEVADAKYVTVSELKQLRDVGELVPFEYLDTLITMLSFVTQTATQKE